MNTVKIQVMHTAIAPTKHNNVGSTFNPCSPDKQNWVKRFLMRFSKEGRSIRRGLKEAELIHAGKKEGKSFDSFLNEI
jgi:hypothetical protein